MHFGQIRKSSFRLIFFKLKQQMFRIVIVSVIIFQNSYEETLSSLKLKSQSLIIVIVIIMLQAMQVLTRNY